MTITELSQRLATATREFEHDRRDALAHQDENLSSQGLAQERQDRVAKARTAYARTVAQVRAEADVIRRQQDKALDRIPAPNGSTRDAWDRARMLLDAGRRMSDVIAHADRDMLLGIREWGPTYLEAQRGTPGLGEDSGPLDTSALDRSLRTRWAQVTGDRDLRTALDQAPALAELDTNLNYAELVAAGHDHAGGLYGAIAADLARQAAARDWSTEETEQEAARA